MQCSKNVLLFSEDYMIIMPSPLGFLCDIKGLPLEGQRIIFVGQKTDADN